MHDIEPHFLWRDKYIASEDRHSPFYGREYDEFSYHNKIYNYLLHPQWDEFGSSTLYMKVLYANYEKGVAIMEMIGEWNDCLHNDIMHLKREVVDAMLAKGISRFILICENVLNFHAGDDDYYAEWQEDVAETGGWVCLMNTLQHVEAEMSDAGLQQFLHFGNYFNNIEWRLKGPKKLFNSIDSLISGSSRRLLD
jgi:hypothetical protein